MLLIEPFIQAYCHIVCLLVTEGDEGCIHIVTPRSDKCHHNCIDNDILKKSSTKGIGHDDIIIYVNDTEVAKYGSQGQNRTALLSMKIGEFELLKTQKENVPLILLDDVFSELDNERINFLLDYIKKYQVFITTTTVENIKMDNVKFFDIEKIRTCEKK